MSTLHIWLRPPLLGQDDRRQSRFCIQSAKVNSRCLSAEKQISHASVHLYTVRVHRDTFYPQPCLFSFAHVSWTRRHEERAFNGSPPCVYENLFQSKTKCFFTQESAELTAQFAFDSHPVETANRAAARRHFSGNRKKKLARYDQQLSESNWVFARRVPRKTRN